MKKNVNFSLLFIIYFIPLSLNFNTKSFMKKFIFFCGLLYATSLLSQDRPNIVLIVSDDHSYQTIGAYNKGVTDATPAIDKLAKEGVTFNKAFVTNSICGPSRACILTGKYSHKNGFMDNETSHYNSSQQQFVNLLQQGGYQTAWIGKYHLGDDPKGFDFFKILVDQGRYFNPDFIIEGKQRVREQGYVSNIIEDEAEKWLDRRDPNKPFCLVVGHKAIHRTWMPDLPELGAYEHVNFELPDTFFDDYATRQPASMQEMAIGKDMHMGYDLKMFKDEKEEVQDANFSRMTATQLAHYNDFYNPIRQEYFKAKLSGSDLAKWKFQRYMRDYLSTVKSMDKNIQRMLDYLEKHHLKDNTVIIYLSDQGFYMGEHGWFDKRWMYEESFRTPMIVSYPKLFPKGSTNDDFVLNIDLAPTFLELAGVKVPNDIQGKSFLPLFGKKSKPIRQQLFYHYYENGEHAVSPHFGVRTDRYKLIRYYKRVNTWELFDLKTDPKELHNVYGKKEYQKITKQLESLLLKEIRDKQDDLAERVFFNKEFPVK